MIQAAPQTGQKLSTSMFYMWRCVISIAHADGKVEDAEHQYLNRIFDGMTRAYGLTADQREAFKDDLENPKDIAGLLPFINDPAVRGQLVYFGGLLARADGMLDPREDRILKKLRADQLSGLDLDTIRQHTQKVVADQMFKHDLDMSAIRPQSGLTAVLDAFLLRLGIDVLEE